MSTSTARRPGWVDAWCVEHLGSKPEAEIFRLDQMSLVMGLALEDGRQVVVKARPDEGNRATACVRTQATLAEAGLPVARPLTPAVVAAGWAVHAEEWRDGGEVRRGDDQAHARSAGRELARMTAVTASLVAVVGSPLPNPVWVRWTDPQPGIWPSTPAFDERAKTIPMPGRLDEIAVRIRRRLLRTDLPDVLGHADWEAQNLRWEGDRLYVAHDWDSLARLPEAAVVGAASGSFGSTEVPTLAPVTSSAAFIDAYEQFRGRPFTREETQIAWAASMGPAAHNARGETLYAHAPTAWTALEEQADERLRRAAA